ncbi:shikimate kinase [Caloranaerobacter azorensis]|uniref:Shikimate kinase n=1 Tax=Caloranaerobacter azorensis TaxID=116090 RepID=A0A6P1YAV4_9FIRM|nr:shikimate kinase [Caloranaerobacter azorensis]QIB25998.1 shikimate kinase [Caloranaerobacter azorensis]
MMMSGDKMGKNNIVLIGFMGTGKSHVGRYISKKLNMEFYDTDNIIEKKYGCSISYIFERYGENYFRKIESEVISNVSQNRNIVISTGGGVVLDKSNIEMLKKNGVIFLLDGSFDTIVNNLYGNVEKRPLLKGTDWKKKANELFLRRKKLYYNSADYIIGIDNKKGNAIAEEIINIYNLQI